MQLLNAVCKLRSDLTLIGNGSELLALKKYAEINQIDVKFKGRISYDGVANEFAKHDIFISTTLFEGNPKTIIEALASGLICIVPDIESVRNIVLDGRNGFLHDNSITGIVEVITRVRRLSNTELIEVSKRARQSVISRYNLHTIAEKELGVYRS